MSKPKCRGFRGAQPEGAQPPASSPQPGPVPHAGLSGGSRIRAPAPAGQQQMRAGSRAGAQRRRGPARRGAHREAGGCDRGRTRSSGGGRSNALWRAVDAAEEVPSPKEPPLMLGDTGLDFLRTRSLASARLAWEVGRRTKLEASTPDSTDHPKAAQSTQSQKSSPARTSVLWRLQEACSAHTCSGP
ncbi:LOW QUALITY PROTEIN: putative insulin-like growth factor 2 antisense gene protein [Rhinopithecus roxellana]|uniref:LOW QUALITY PROTEIN: putative insulin-like growth factor 2 antisense gene protein n=1 Tax=Rhinopithecus bieti TaxID=61621 RepID=UPI00083C6641|nr:PREDICTED: LOW QUALITY PROTEIN: putative insulin-like growth factor 2 antisense gene protein [Rhinopithecus bieti]XP_030773783.1 LOW QUALITY PROTEIN: putative insulin-like growth factor 2 antisense gene protein [Rhinopithecus roxellana]